MTTGFGYFPAPYPDELLYSVLCRYHMRSGNTYARSTNSELWGKAIGPNAALPGSIDRIARNIPSAAGLTSEHFISDNTIYPLLKPFISQERNRLLIEVMTNHQGTGTSNAFAVTGLAWAKHNRKLYLCCCEQCVIEDIKVYGEPYWHRVHQLPGVLVCDKHHSALAETDIRADSLSYDYQPLTVALNATAITHGSAIVEKHAGFSEDAAWLLRVGSSLGHYGETTRLYDNWLRARRFRAYGGATNHKKLAAAIINYYGEEYLSAFDAYNSGTCKWAKGILQYPGKFMHPVYHLLLFRFLAGSADNFFFGKCALPGEHRPFGTPPHPCRNVVCDHYLQDVIEKVETTKSNRVVRTKFTCPYCGFAYQRKKPLPKENQYSDRVYIVDYGSKWHRLLIELISAGYSISHVADILHCAVHTVLQFGVQAGILLEDHLVKRKNYPHKRPVSTAPLSFSEKRDAYRQRWSTLMLEYPSATRGELLLKDEKCHAWLKKNDSSWYEANTPARNASGKWAENDAELAARLKTAAEQMRIEPGKPIWITTTSVSKKAGVAGLQSKMASGRLPQTESTLRDITESMEQWHQRKALWAIDALYEHGTSPTHHRVKEMAGISDKVATRLKDFILQNIGLLC